MEDEGNLQKPIVIELETDDKREVVRGQWHNFDAAQCMCFNEKDKMRIMNVVEQFPGGEASFNEYVKSIACTMWPLGK